MWTVDRFALKQVLILDIQEMDAEIKSLQDGLKSKVAGLQKMEGWCVSLSTCPLSAFQWQVMYSPKGSN